MRQRLCNSWLPQFWSQLCKTLRHKWLRAKDLFSLVSDIALLSDRSARFEPAITTWCRSPLLRRRQLAWAVGCTHFTWSLALSQTALGPTLRQRQIVRMLSG